MKCKTAEQAIAEINRITETSGWGSGFGVAKVSFFPPPDKAFTIVVSVRGRAMGFVQEVATPIEASPRSSVYVDRDHLTDDTRAQLIAWMREFLDGGCRIEVEGTRWGTSGIPKLIRTMLGRGGD